MHCWWIFDFETDYYIYIIDDDRTIIGFVGFVANLLNRPTDGVRKSKVTRYLVTLRKRVTFHPLVLKNVFFFDTVRI
jgi:Mg/Co/Ni transporter MgtE